MYRALKMLCNRILTTFIKLIQDIDFYLDVVILAISYFIHRYIVNVLIIHTTYETLDLVKLSILNGVVIGIFGLILSMRILNAYKEAQLK